MSGEDRQDRERSRHLLMAELDGELTPQERGELERALAADAELRAERARLHELKEVTGAMKLKEPPEEIWEGYWVSVYNRAERGLGWVLLSLGAVVLLLYGSWHAVWALLDDPALPLPIKLAIFGVAAGGLILLFSVGREKLFTRLRDPYKEIQR